MIITHIMVVENKTKHNHSRIVVLVPDIRSEDGKLYMLDATTGTLKWSYITGSYNYSSPAVADGVVYVGSSDSNMHAFHLPSTTP
jgi:outer membrane protein assembly factor BamB